MTTPITTTADRLMELAAAAQRRSDAIGEGWFGADEVHTLIDRCDGKLVAACDPQTITALCSAIKEMAAERDALRYAIATTEFATKAKLFFRADITIANTSLMNLEMQKRLFEDVTGMSVELSDQRYFYQTAAGAIEGTRYLPINEVIIDSSQNDGNSAVWDMAQGPVIETMLLGLNPAAVVGGGLPEARRGPIGYMTFPPDLNPPNVTVWGVDCAFPRRHMPAANAHMTVGSFTDMIPVADISF